MEGEKRREGFGATWNHYQQVVSQVIEKKKKELTSPISTAQGARTIKVNAAEMKVGGTL